MKKNVFIVFFILIGNLLSAQQDKKTDKFLTVVSSRYKKFKSIKADFVYNIESPADKIKEKQKGTIYIKGKKFRLEIAGQIIICDEKTIWTYNKEANEVQINKYNPAETAIKLDDIFTMYNKGFLYRTVEDKKEGGRDLTVIELTPKDKKKNFFKIKLTIDKPNQTIIKSFIYDKNGTVHQYTITNQVPNLRLEDHFFSFDPKKYPKIEITDLRN